MAKRERNKRAARKARQQERQRVAAAQAAAGTNEQTNTSKSLFKKSDGKGRPATKNVPTAKAERSGIGVVTGYLSDVRAEMRQVTWPSRTELRNYSVTVIVALIVFGVAIWLVDTGFVAALVQFTNLRG